MGVCSTRVRSVCICYLNVSRKRIHTLGTVSMPVLQGLQGNSTRWCVCVLPCMQGLEEWTLSPPLRCHALSHGNNTPCCSRDKVCLSSHETLLLQAGRKSNPRLVPSNSSVYMSGHATKALNSVYYVRLPTNQPSWSVPLGERLSSSCWGRATARYVDTAISALAGDRTPPPLAHQYINLSLQSDLIRSTTTLRSPACSNRT